MGWTTNYSGPQIDETLEKGRDLKVVCNGWINLEASASSPTNLGNLRNPGNYITFYWTDGPTLSQTVSPLNITVVMINGTLHQFVNALGYTYSRATNENDVFSNWVIDQTYGIMRPGASAPTSLVDGKTLWLDTTTASTPILKLYVNGAWKEVIPASIMQTTIYDPRGKKSDIFKYIEDSMNAIFSSTGSITFESHINSSDIHITAAEKNKWDTSPTNTSLDDKVEELKADIDSNVTNGFKNDLAKFEALEQAVTEAEAIYDHHTENTIIHPNSTKRNAWNSKADRVHSHQKDGKVIVDPAHVNGVIPASKLPYDSKERVYVVTSINAMYALQKNPVHNGDFICVESASGNAWYVVVDDTYLGKTTQTGGVVDASKAFKELSNSSKSWSVIKNKPTTISGYGITDAASQSDITSINNRVNTINGNLSTADKTNINSIAAAEAARNKAYDLLSTIEVNSFAIIDAIIANLESISQ